MKIIKAHNKFKKSESGNMILALFAAVALVGTIGASTTIIMRGPMKVMSNVNQKTMTESQLMLSSKMVMLDTANLTTKDCDGDRLNEPREWRDAGGLGPVGGGFIPAEIGVSKSDSWGNQYGYCVWDHGALIDDVGCGGATQLRLPGLNSVKYPVIAVISAGPNGTFDTTCRSGVDADVGITDGDLEDPGDLPLIERGVDDLIVTYSYAEASKENPSLWALDYDSEGNVLAVMDSSIQSVDFAGSNTSFGGNLALTGAQGLNIPDEIALPTCDASTEKEIRRNMAGASPALEICEEISAPTYAWVELSTGSASAPSKTITQNDAGPGCVPTDTSMSVIGNFSYPNTPRDIKLEGNYLYVSGSGNNGISSLDISNPRALSIVDTITNAATMLSPRNFLIDGNYAYVSDKDGDNLTIINVSDPANLVELDSFSLLATDNPTNLAKSGDFLFLTASGTDTLFAFDVSNPTSIVQVDSITNSSTMNINEQIVISGDYAFMTGVASDSFVAIDISDPSNMIELDSIINSTTLNRAFKFVVKGNYAYVSSLDSGRITVIDISDPTNLVELDNISSLGILDEVRAIEISGNYLFAAIENTNLLKVFDITDPNDLIEIASKNLSALITKPDSMQIRDNYLFLAERDNERILTIDLCAEDYQSQVTVTQPAVSGTTIGSVGWSQVNPSDDNGDQAGIAFVVDKNAHKGSAPMAALSAIREGDPALAGLAFKTKDLDGSIGSSVYLGTNGRLALDTSNAGDSSEIYSYLQIGDHGPGSWNSVDYLFGLFVTSDTGVTDQLAYFGFEGDDDASGTILFSKDLRIKRTNITGDVTNEAIRFESDQATTFFVDLMQQTEGSSTSFLNKSFAPVNTESGSLYFERSRGSIDTPTDIQKNDVLGTITLGSDATNTRAPKITAIVSDAPTNSGADIPTDLIFKTGDTETCISNNGGPFQRIADLNHAARAVWGDGTYLYGTAYDNGLNVYSVEGSTFTLLDTSFTGGQTRGVTGDGTYIYVADTGGIAAYSFDGTTLTELDVYGSAGTGYEVYADGSYVYLADGAAGVHVLTFDGTSFTLVDTFDTDGSAEGIWGDGNYVYVADGANGIIALLFNGTSFTEIDTYTTTQAEDVHGDGLYIYVADFTDGMYAFSFDGTSFTEVGNIAAISTPLGVWTDGIYVYYAQNQDFGAYSFDGSTFTLTENINSFGTGDALSVWGDGTYIYYSRNFGRNEVYSGFECSYNSEMRLTKDGTLGINKQTPQAKIHSSGRIRSDEGIMIGNDANCSTGADTGVMRYTGTPAEPFEVCDGTAWQGLSTYTAGASAVDTVNCSPISFELLDVADVALNTDIETNKILIGGLSKPCDLSVASDASSITINKNGSDETGTIVSVDNGDTIFLKIRSANIEITETNTYVSLGDKTDQVTIETECTGALIEEDTLTDAVLDDVAGITIDGDYAYLVSYGFDGIISVDISDPTNLVIADSLTSISDMGNPGKLTIQGDVAYVAAYGYSRIASIDISDPTSLVILDSTNGTNISNPGAVAVNGDYAFLANSDGIISVDISDPSNMSEVDHLPSADMDDATDIKIIGDHAFVVAYTDRTLTSIDISDPTNLVQVDSTTSPSDSLRTVNDMAVKGHYIFATSNISDSVAVFDVSDPTNLTEIEDYIIPSAINSQAIAILENYAYVSDTNSESIAQIDISDPINLSEKAFVTSANIENPIAIATKGEYVFVGASAGDSITSFKIKCQ